VNAVAFYRLHGHVSVAMPTIVGDIAVTSPMEVKLAQASGSLHRRDAVKIVFRKLVRQLPPHDFDPRHCGSLDEPDERATMEEFVEMRIRSALGKGLVARCPSGNCVTISCHEVGFSAVIDCRTNVKS